MKKTIWAVFNLLIFSFGASAAFGQYAAPEFSKAGRTYRYVWGDFQDARLLMKTDDQLLQVLAVRHGELQLKVGSIFATQWKVAGLWHAYQAADKTWVSNGVVADLIAPILEQIQVGKAMVAVDISEARLAAASDSAGRLHAVITGAGEGERRFFYAVRDADNQWHVMQSDPIPDDLAEPFCIPQADGNRLMLLALIRGGENDSRMVKYALSPSLGGGRDTFRWTRELFPEDLKAKTFAVLQDNRTFIFFLQSSADGSFRAVDRDVATGKWNLDPQRFEPSFRGNISRVTFRNLTGFLGQDGLPQVIGLYSPGGADALFHFYRDEIGLWHNNDAVLSVSNIKQVSACLDVGGLLNVSGVTTDGRIWQGYRSEGMDWRSHGLIFNSNSR